MSLPSKGLNNSMVTALPMLYITIINININRIFTTILIITINDDDDDSISFFDSMFIAEFHEYMDSLILYLDIIV